MTGFEQMGEVLLQAAEGNRQIAAAISSAMARFSQRVVQSLRNFSASGWNQQ
jgi:hypothetical protein